MARHRIGTQTILLAWPAQYLSRSSRLYSLPVGWRGNSAAKSIGTRALDRRQLLAAEGDQLLLQRLARIGHVARLHHGLDLFAELLVRHAEHRHVQHLGVRDQQVLGLLRIDVHAAGDDHVRLAIGQVQVAFRVHMADVAERGPALGVAALRRSCPGRCGIRRPCRQRSRRRRSGPPAVPRRRRRRCAARPPPHARPCPCARAIRPSSPASCPCPRCRRSTPR